MRFLLPSGGIVDHRFGILTAPNHRGVPAGIIEGMEWGADLGVLDGPEIIKRFDPDVAFPWLDSMLTYRSTCLFVPVPDVYGNAKATIEAYHQWVQYLAGWPLAFVAQDGLKISNDSLYVGSDEDFTDWAYGRNIDPEDNVAYWQAHQEWRSEIYFNEFDCLFIGGTTEWKESPIVIDIIKRGQAFGKHIHIGRINNWRRYSLFRQIKGSEEFTCDGTKQRYIGIKNTVELWAWYQERLVLPLF